MCRVEADLSHTFTIPSTCLPPTLPPPSPNSIPPAFRQSASAAGFPARQGARTGKRNRRRRDAGEAPIGRRDAHVTQVDRQSATGLALSAGHARPGVNEAGAAVIHIAASSPSTRPCRTPREARQQRPPARTASLPHAKSTFPKSGALLPLFFISFPFSSPPPDPQDSHPGKKYSPPFSFPLFGRSNSDPCLSVDAPAHTVSAKLGSRAPSARPKLYSATSPPPVLSIPPTSVRAPENCACVCGTFRPRTLLPGTPFSPFLLRKPGERSRFAAAQPCICRAPSATTYYPTITTTASSRRERL